MNKHINKLALAVSLAIASTHVSANALSTQMDKAFGALSNTTSPSAYNSARRGVFTGGQVYMKFPTKRVNPVSMTAPRFGAGCGGIDLYGGSFSYINADQMIQTFQAIGANALGYGVKLAVTSACPTCEQIMTSLEKTAQAINALNIDSCKAAEGIVDMAFDKSQEASVENAAKLAGVNTGLFEDAGNAWARVGTETTSASEEIKTKKPDIYNVEMTGNIAWRIFKEHKINDAFDATSDDSFLEILMSMTGTVIMDDPEQANTETTPTPSTIAGYQVTLKDLITGKDIKAYKCDSTDINGCKSPSLVDIADSKKGIEQRFIDAFTKTGGVIESLQNKTEWSAEAKSTISSITIMGKPCLDKVYQGAASGASTETLTKIVEVCAPVVSVEMASALANDYLITARNLVSIAKVSEPLKPTKQAMLDVFNSSLNSYYEEAKSLRDQYKYSDMITTLNTITFNDGQPVQTKVNK
jgi:conjugative transfer pilus assembly protein TraH